MSKKRVILCAWLVAIGLITTTAATILLSATSPVMADPGNRQRGGSN